MDRRGGFADRKRNVGFPSMGIVPPVRTNRQTEGGIPQAPDRHCALPPRRHCEV